MNFTINTKTKFTFQYGQIYYMYPHNPELEKREYLHSNMVRFIITQRTKKRGGDY